MKTKLFATILLAIICFSNNVNAQNTLTSSNTVPDINLGNSPAYKTNKQRSVIQKNDSIYNWQWDLNSKAWKRISKYINIVYDSNNNQTSFLYLTWKSSYWEIGYKYTSTFDSNNNQTSSIRQAWIGSAWVTYSRDTITYDAYNNQTSSINQSWDGSALINYSKETYTYDTKNNLKIHISQTWYMGDWENANRYIYTYDTKNNRTSYTIQRWTDYWKDHQKYIYTYDAKNNLINTRFQQVNYNSNGKFVNMSQYIYNYDSNNNQTDYLYQTWDGDILKNNQKCTYTYDTKNNQTSYFIQQWDQDSNDWIIFYKGNFLYDANNNQISINRYMASYWGSNTWWYFRQARYTFDANNFKKSETNKDLNSDEITIASGDSTFYYFYSPVGIDFKTQETCVSIYPNPSNGKFTINSLSAINSIRIYSFTGVLLYSNYNLKGQTSIEIELSDLEKGIYFARIQDGKQILTKKIIIQ